MRSVVLKAHPYSHKVYVRRCTEDEGHKWLARHGDAAPLTEYRATMHPHATKSKVFVWLNPKAGLPEICHEFVHAATFILKDSGVPVNWTNDEALAYLVEYLVSAYLRHEDRKARASMRVLAY